MALSVKMLSTSDHVFVTLTSPAETSVVFDMHAGDNSNRLTEFNLTRLSKRHTQKAAAELAIIYDIHIPTLADGNSIGLDDEKAREYINQNADLPFSEAENSCGNTIMRLLAAAGANAILPIPPKAWYGRVYSPTQVLDYAYQLAKTIILANGGIENTNFGLAMPIYTGNAHSQTRISKKQPNQYTNENLHSLTVIGDKPASFTMEPHLIIRSQANDHLNRAIAERLILRKLIECMGKSSDSEFKDLLKKENDALYKLMVKNQSYFIGHFGAGPLVKLGMMIFIITQLLSILKALTLINETPTLATTALMTTVLGAIIYGAMHVPNYYSASSHIIPLSAMQLAMDKIQFDPVPDFIQEKSVFNVMPEFGKSEIMLVKGKSPTVHYFRKSDRLDATNHQIINLLSSAPKAGSGSTSDNMFRLHGKKTAANSTRPEKIEVDFSMHLTPQQAREVMQLGLSPELTQLLSKLNIELETNVDIYLAKRPAYSR